MSRAQQHRGEPARLQGDGKRAGRGGQQFVDQPLGQRLGGVDEDELGALVLVGVGDERGDHDGETVDSRVADRGAALLAVDDPAGLVLVRQVTRSTGMMQRAGPRVAHGRGAVQGLEPDPLVERDDEGVGDHRRLGFEVPADRGDVREHLGALIALDLGVAVAVDPGYRRERRQFLAVDSEAVQHPALTLAHLKRGQAQFGLVAVHAIEGNAAVGGEGHAALPAR